MISINRLKFQKMIITAWFIGQTIVFLKNLFVGTDNICIAHKTREHNNK